MPRPWDFFPSPPKTHNTHHSPLPPLPPSPPPLLPLPQKNMMSASEASDENTIEYDDVQAPNFEDGARDIQNQVSHRVGTATTQAPWPWWRSIVVVVFVGIIRRQEECHWERWDGEKVEGLQH